MDINNFKRDTNTIEAGKWVGEIPNCGEMELKVRGMGSKLFTTRVAALSRARPKSERNTDGSLKNEFAILVTGQAAAETLLLDWRGLTDDGEAVPYSKELATVWCTESDYRPFLDAVLYAATVVERGVEAVKEDLSKN